jgi:hypothetical protein
MAKSFILPFFGLKAAEEEEETNSRSAKQFEQ